MIVFSLSAVSADDLQTTDSGEVSGDVDLATVNPWDTTGELTYDIPSEAKDIKSADVYVNVYGGSAKNTHGANANVSLKTVNGENQIASEELWIEDGSTDGTIYPVNDHTDKCYSDYQMHYDITDSLKGLNGSSIAIKVDTFEMDNKTFDGRIKLIALILAYDDGDNDKIAYWVDATQKWTKTNVTTTFATENFADIVKADLTNIALSSGDGSFKLNDELLGDPDNHTSGNYYQYSTWDVSSKITEGQSTEVLSMYAGTSAYGSLKNVLTVLKLQSKTVAADVSLATEYTSVNTCYAGTNNTLTIKANANKQGKYLIELLADGSVVDSTEVELDGENETTLLLTDPTIRPIDETTVNGANNTQVTYAVNVKSGDVVIGNAEKTVPVLYNGNLGKNLAYDAKYIEDVETFTITGDVVIDVQDVSSYMSAAAQNRTDIWDVKLNETLSLANAFVYVAYNWDKSGEAGPVFNVTFNGNAVAPKASYRDQSNLGNYGKYGYGLFIYDVSDLIQIGNNTLVLNKESGLTAVYPSTLIYLYNDAGSKTLATVYMANGADLLSNANNNAGRIAETTNVLSVDAKDAIDARFVVLAASAQQGEANVIFNGNETVDVWNGTSNSVEVYIGDAKDSIADTNNISFVATGSTILALNQIVITIKDAPVAPVAPAKIKTVVKAPKVTNKFKKSKYFKLKVLKKSNKKPVKKIKVKVRVYTGKKYKTYTVKTNKKGIAKLNTKKLKVGKHKVKIYSGDSRYKISAKSVIKIKK
ncbi:DUF3344 domain-containing protein [Methanobrevibacter sp.]|uniref:DUF3344 domain-containing protein n=1 Tax=Methanobrevibacter sp. TaxID=66852 RepID=UPI00388D30B1